MTEPRAPMSADDPGETVSPLMHNLAVAILALPIAGLAVHAALYALLPPETLRQYVYGTAMKIVAFVAFCNLVGNWFHYRRTRMRMDVASRVLTYLWLLSVVLLLRAAYPGR